MNVCHSRGGVLVPPWGKEDGGDVGMYAVVKVLVGVWGLYVIRRRFEDE